MPQDNSSPADNHQTMPPHGKPEQSTQAMKGLGNLVESVTPSLIAAGSWIFGGLIALNGGFSPVFKGVRTFELRPRNDGSTDFAMRERFSGLMLPLIKRSLPDFGPVFERYANDLKHEAERAAA